MVTSIDSYSCYKTAGQACSRAQRAEARRAVPGVVPDDKEEEEEEV